MVISTIFFTLFSFLLILFKYFKVCAFSAVETGANKSALARKASKSSWPRRAVFTIWCRPKCSRPVRSLTSYWTKRTGCSTWDSNRKSKRFSSTSGRIVKSSWQGFFFTFLFKSFRIFIWFVLFVFSATWPEGIRRIANEYMDNPLQVCVGTLDLAAVHSVTQHVEILNEEDKRQRVYTR